MKRRTFLTASCLAGTASLTQLAQAAEGEKPAAKELYELRLYELEAGDKAQRFTEFLGKVAVPAWNRIGIGPVGVFSIQSIGKESQEDNPNVYVLLPHCCFESVVTATEKLLADEEYVKAGAEILHAAKKDPAFARVTSSLSLAFDDCHKLEVPTKKDSRVLQLRIYESHCQPKAKKKVEMFNDGGELSLFREVGMNPVFFGETLIGPLVPNLTYMLGFDDEEAKDAAWAKFLAHPKWDVLKKLPQFADTVSRITNIMLRPLEGSQV